MHSTRSDRPAAAMSDGPSGLRVTQRDAGATDREPLSQVTKACAYAAPEVHDVRSRERRVDAPHDRHDLVVDIVERLVLRVGIGAQMAMIDARPSPKRTNDAVCRS